MSNKTLQQIDYLLEDSKYNVDEYMFFYDEDGFLKEKFKENFLDLRDINLGKMETISQEQVNAIAKEIYGYDYSPSYNEILKHTDVESYDVPTGLQDYMLTRADKQ